MSTSKPTLCACGCGQVLQGTGRQRYFNAAHRQRAHRRREVQRADAREASVSAALAARGADLHELVELLATAAEEARRRPGSVVLRVGGRLVALDGGALRALVASARGAEALEVADQTV